LFLSIRPTRGLVNLFGHDVSLLGKDQSRIFSQTHRHRAAGFPPARPYDDLRKRRTSFRVMGGKNPAIVAK